MFIRKSSIRRATAAAIIALAIAVLSIPTTATSANQLTFIDSVSEFFGVTPVKQGLWESNGKKRPERIEYADSFSPAATVFTETIGSPSGTTLITAYSGWSNPGLTFTGSGDVRTSTPSTGYAGASGSGNVFLTSTAGRNFQISGIDTSVYTAGSLTLSFGVYKSTTASNGSEFTVEVSSDGTTYTPLTFPALTTGSGTAIWFLRTATGSIPATSNLRVRFTNTTAATQFRIDDVSLQGTLAGATAPVLTTPTATGGTNNSATLGAEITSDGGSPISSRGTVWKASAGVTATDNPLAEGGTATGVFSHLRTSITPPGTQIFYRGYAVNGSGTGLSPESSFFTLSTEPANHAAAFTGAPFSSTQVDLSFSAASTILATGYIILRRNDGTFPDATGIVDGIAPGSLSLPVGTTLVTTITSDATTTFSNTSLTNNTEYRYALIPFGYNGTNAATYNYRTAATIPTATVTTAAASSDVVPVAASESARISSLINDVGPLTSSTGAQVWQVTVRDGGATSPDGDALPTIINALTIGRGGASVVTNFTTTIQRADLFDGTTNLGTATITANSLAFTGLTVSTPDDGTKTLSLRISLKPSGLVDNQTFQFNLASAGVTTAGASTSSQIASFATIVSSPTQNKIDVVATNLAFGVQPSNVGTGSPMTPAPTVFAADVNLNTDVDYATNIDVTATGSVLTGSPVSVNPGAGTGTATFTGLTFTTAGTGVTLNATSGALTNVTSGTFNVLALPLPGEIVINQISPDYNGASNEYVEIVNLTNKTFDLSLLRLEYHSAGGTVGGAGGLLSGTLQPYSFWLLSPDATITVGQTVAVPRDGVITAGFAAAAGQISLRLASSPNTVIDGVGYGVVTTPITVETTAAGTPPTDGGITRIVDGVDTNSNLADFQTVANANIYLRNSNSRLIPTGATLAGGSYANVSAQNNSTLAGDVAISGRLTLGGVLTTGTNTIFLPCAATVVGANATNYVNGNVEREFCAVTGVPFSYPVGQAGYTPVEVDITAGTFPSRLTVTSYDSKLSEFPAATSLSRNWGLIETGEVTATLSFTYDDSDINGDESTYQVWRRESSGTITDMCGGVPCVTTATNTLGPVVGVTQFSRWTGSGSFAPTAAGVGVAGRVMTADGLGIGGVLVTVSGGDLAAPRTAISSPFGYYFVDDLTAGTTYVVSVNSKRYAFDAPTRLVTLGDNIADLDFIAATPLTVLDSPLPRR